MENIIKFLGNLQSYFNDFIGAVAPAVILVVGLSTVPGFSLSTVVANSWGEFRWLAITVVLFGIGHFLIAMSDVLRRLFHANSAIRKDVIQRKCDENSAYLTMREFVRTQNQIPSNFTLSFSSVRNIAMSLSDVGEELGRRFMFVALFCYGTGAAFFVVALAHLFFGRFDISTFGLATTYFVGWWFMSKRGASFEMRALTVPFSTALAEIIVHSFGVKAGHSAAATIPVVSPQASIVATPPKAPNELPA